MQPPVGAVTFLFTDIESSSRLWEQFPAQMATALAAHDRIQRETIAAHAGFVFKTVGDAFCAAFADPLSAVTAAVTVQQAMAAHPWEETGPLKVRMGLHTGTAEFRDNDYFGPPLNRAARICSAGHGGQVLVSAALAALVEGASQFDLTALGDFRLRNLHRTERIYQVTAPGLATSFPPLRSAKDAPGNLPVPPTTFVGREEELEQVKTLVGRTRALTLLGTGGTGKTRLAIEAARELSDAYYDGAWLVELATLTEPFALHEAIAASLGIREEAGQTVTETVSRYLREREILLVIDNCEHLIARVTAGVSQLLAHCPKLRIIATSRQALHVAGEITLPLRPLRTFDVWRRSRDVPLTAADVGGFAAVQLFVERAQSVRPGFALDDGNAADIARICWRLDGIPLAIELAAARLRVLTPAQIAERLNDQFRLLRGGNTVLPHQQTLRALIDWSYDLLDERERILFHRLAIFAGGRTLPAVESVCSGGEIEPEDILDLLQQLADKSLVFIEDDPAGTRYVLLESVWQYAREKLEASGEMDALQERHFQHFLALAESADPHLRGPDPAVWITRLRSESLNLRNALEFAATRRDENAFRLAASLERYWEIAGNLEEARKHLDAILHHTSSISAHHARAIMACGRMAWAQDRYAESRSLAQRGAAIYRQLGLRAELATVQGHEGFVALSSGDLEAAEILFSEAHATGEALGDSRLLALATAGRGSIAAQRGELERALEIKLDALARFRALGDKWIVGYSLWGVAQVALALERPDEARTALREWALIAAEVGNRWSLPYLLQLLADAARLEGKPELAARLFGAAERRREELAIRFTPHEQAAYDDSIKKLAADLPEKDLRMLWDAGRHLRPDAALELALAG